MIWLLLVLYFLGAVLVFDVTWNEENPNGELIGFSKPTVNTVIFGITWPFWALLIFFGHIWKALTKLWHFVAVKFSDTFFGQKIIIYKWNKYDFNEDIVKQNATRLLKNSKKIARRKLLKEYLENRLSEN